MLVAMRPVMMLVVINLGKRVALAAVRTMRAKPTSSLIRKFPSFAKHWRLCHNTGMAGLLLPALVVLV